MNKKIFFTLSLLSILVFLSGCGGGGVGGSLSAPPGTNPGVPSVIKLLDVQNIAQTNSTVYLKAKVLDGNGKPQPNVPVTFTNLSAPFGQLSATIVNTDATGIATVALNSAVPGFSSIMAEVTGGAGQVRDVNTVYFTSSLSMNLTPTMVLDVDGNSNGIYNESSDFILFENTNDTQVIIRATVLNSIGLLTSGVSVTFGSDFPFKIGSAATCSDGSATCEVLFPLGNTATTNSNGEAFVLVQVAPNVLSSIATVLNITATADNGAFNLVSLFLNPVTLNSVVVRAAPTTVASGGSSTISATVTTNTGGPVPDGTTVNFTSTAGLLDTPFAQTTDGVATTKLTAPTVTSDTNITVTASVGGVSGTTSVVVTVAPVTPPPPTALTLTATSALAVDGNVGGTVTFTVSGGASTTYSSTSANPLLVFNDNGIGTGGVANDTVRESGESGVWPGASFKATIESCTPAGTVVISATDGTTIVTKTITIQNAAGTTAADRPTILPATATICETNGTCSAGVATATYTLTLGAGATSPVTVTSSNIAVIANPGSIVIPPGTFIVDANAIAADTTVNLLVTNILGCKAGATVKVINQ